jgi:hypothetical protein
MYIRPWLALESGLDQSQASRLQASRRRWQKSHQGITASQHPVNPACLRQPPNPVPPRKISRLFLFNQIRSGRGDQTSNDSTPLTVVVGFETATDLERQIQEMREIQKKNPQFRRKRKAREIRISRTEDHARARTR